MHRLSTTGNAFGHPWPRYHRPRKAAAPNFQPGFAKGPSSADLLDLGVLHDGQCHRGMFGQSGTQGFTASLGGASLYTTVGQTQASTAIKPEPRRWALATSLDLTRRASCLAQEGPTIWRCHQQAGQSCRPSALSSTTTGAFRQVPHRAEG